MPHAAHFIHPERVPMYSGQLCAKLVAVLLCLDKSKGMETRACDYVSAMQGDTTAVDANVKRLLALQVACVTPLYIVEWLARPWAELGSHVLFGSIADGNLATAQQQRGTLTAGVTTPQGQAGSAL
jgi:hypothetical protein